MTTTSTPRSHSADSQGSPRVADLHLHTQFSDGTDTPERVVELARAQGLSAIAITDHDETQAIARTVAAAGRYAMEVISGIEMSASVDGLEVHLLGFGFDVNHAGLRTHLAEQKARRVHRVREMVGRLRQVGVTLDAEEVFQVAGEGTVGRPHVAQVLLRHGYVSTHAEAFSRYIGPNNPGFVPGSPLPPARIIQVIRAAGGVPVLAHPVYLHRDDVIPEFVKDGLAGLEVYHPGHTPDLVQRYAQLADRLKLLKTGGSDYHGTTQEGAPIGAVKVPYTLIEALRQWQRDHPSTNSS